jgi:hypothetical protein
MVSFLAGEEQPIDLKKLHVCAILDLQAYIPQRPLPPAPIPHAGLPQPPAGIIGRLDAPPATWPAGTLNSFVSFGLSHSEHLGFSSELRTKSSMFAPHASQ